MFAAVHGPVILGECYVLSVESRLNFQRNAPWIVTISPEIVANVTPRMSGLLRASQL